MMNIRLLHFRKTIFLFIFRKRFWNPYDELKAFLSIFLLNSSRIFRLEHSKEGQICAYASKCSPWEQKAKYTIILGTTWNC